MRKKAHKAKPKRSPDRLKANHWRKKYIQTLMAHGGMTAGEAMENFEAAGLKIHDFDADPEMAAMDELSYMAADSDGD